MSSSDGFCSTLSFAPGELGQPHTATTAPQPVTSSATSNPLPTPTHAASPAAAPNQPSSVQVIPPASPARSNSTTPASSAPVINNPTPTLGSVPLVTATHSAQPPTLPLTTPPQTPMSSVSQNGSNSTTTANNTVLGKREESQDQQQQEQQPKKRRIAPTLVSTDGPDGGSDSAPAP